MSISPVPPTGASPFERAKETTKKFMEKLKKAVLVVSRHFSHEPTKVFTLTGASGAEIPISVIATTMEGLRRCPKASYSLNGAAGVISGFFALRSIVKRIRKTAAAFSQVKEIERELTSKKARLATLAQTSSTTSPAYVKLNQKITRLEKSRLKCREQLFGIRKVPVRLLEVCAACMALVLAALAIGNKISSQASTAFMAAGTALGCAIGGVSILLGGYESAQGIRKALSNHKHMQEIHEQKNALASRATSQNIEPQTLESLKGIRQKSLLRKEIKARREFTKSVLRACAGGLATVGGALAIAGALTAGWGAIAIGIVMGVVGLSAVGVSIGSFIKARLLSKQMKQIQIEEKDLTSISDAFKGASEAAQEEMADILDIDVHELRLDPMKRLKEEYKKLIE